MNNFKERVQFVKTPMITDQTDGQINSEPVHVHFQNPITQTVHHELKRMGMQQIESVAGAGEIQIQTRILRLQPVISGIVYPAKAKRRAEMISFGSMIVNDIENHFDPCRVQVAHHRLELGDLCPRLSAAGVLRMRREKSDRVVAPVIRQPAIN